MGALCAGISGVTFARTAQALDKAEHTIAEAQKREVAIEQDDEDDGAPAPAGSAAHGAPKDEGHEAPKGASSAAPKGDARPHGDTKPAAHGHE